MRIESNISHLNAAELEIQGVKYLLKTVLINQVSMCIYNYVISINKLIHVLYFNRAGQRRYSKELSNLVKT